MYYHYQNIHTQDSEGPNFGPNPGVIGKFVGQPDKAAKTVLGLMVETMFGGPSFMGRMIPVYSLDSDLLFDQIQKMIAIIHNAGGFVFLVITDNLRANQKAFKLFHEKFGSQDIFVINHHVPNSVFTKLYLLYDPRTFFKNIRNNWVKERMKTPDFV